jgi:hypothetical protein
MKDGTSGSSFRILIGMMSFKDTLLEDTFFNMKLISAHDEGENSQIQLFPSSEGTSSFFIEKLSPSTILEHFWGKSWPDYRHLVR